MAKIGTIACLACGEPIPVKETQGGGVSVCCAWCEVSAYGKAGTVAARIIKARMKPDTAQAEADAPPPRPSPAASKPEPEPAPKPQPKPASVAGLLIG